MVLTTDLIYLHNSILSSKAKHLEILQELECTVHPNKMLLFTHPRVALNILSDENNYCYFVCTMKFNETTHSQHIVTVPQNKGMQVGFFYFGVHYPFYRNP